MTKQNAIQDIRDTLDSLEADYSFFHDQGDYDMCVEIRTQIDLFWSCLVDEIKKIDQYATEADIRYFEGV